MLVLRFCAFALSCFWFAAQAAAQNVDPPRTVAFVVGVQNYDDPDLDKLRFTVRDAWDVFERLRAVATLDLGRSRLLLADPQAPDQRDPSDPDWLIRKNRLGQQELHDELAIFLDSVRDEDTVVFYLGGHGTVQAGRHLLFLPSDYSRRPQRRYWRYSTIMDDIRGRIEERNLRNVRVVFFANMCGAGTAAGEMSAEEDLQADFVRHWLGENTLGFDRFAFFPASAPNRNTFESAELGRSIFAHHLLEGLQGAAAENGVITSETLFDYLNGNMPDDLPRDPDAFDPTIPIGVTREIEARALYHLGLALVADALETDDPLFWRLAERDFIEAIEFSGGGELGAAAALRLAQVRAINGADPTDLAQALERVISWAGDSDLRAAAERLVEAAEGAPTVPFVALIVTSANLAGGAEVRWRAFLEGLPGHRATRTTALDLASEAPERMRQVEDLLAEMKREASGDGSLPHLVLVYSGSAARWQGGEVFPLPDDSFPSLIGQWGGDATLIFDAPFGGYLKDVYDQGLLGDVSLVLSARERNGMNFSGETDGPDTTGVLIEMLGSGITDPNELDAFTEYRAKLASLYPEEQRVLSGPYGSESWTIGTPAVLPSARSHSPVLAQHAKLREQALAGLAPVRRLASLLAADCDLAGNPECERIAPGPLETAADTDLTTALEQLTEAEQPGTQSVYDLLKEAALFDFKGDLNQAFEAYHRFIDAHQAVHQEVRSDGVPDDEVRAAARRSLERLTEQVRNRITGLEGKLVREFRLLLASVPDYASPLVPDLVGATGDLATWEEALRHSAIWRTLDSGEGETYVEVVHLDTSTREALLASLRAAMDAAADEDLVLFVFSGRGIEIGGERFLAPASVFSDANWGLAEPRPLGAFQAAAPTASTDAVDHLSSDFVGDRFRSFSPKQQELVGISEVAELARDHWFVGIYDAQFTQPVFEPGRADGVLDKHLNSVRPAAPEPPSLPAGDMERFLPASGEGRGSHVHIWWEGRLTERLDAVPGCAAGAPGTPLLEDMPPHAPEPAIRSPMSAALLASLKERPHETYRSWIEGALQHPCLGTPTGFGFVAQGSVDLPRFASGNAATLIPFFLGEGERRDANLQLAEHLVRTGSRIGDHPLFALTQAAIAAARVEVDRATLALNTESVDGLEQALSSLRPMLRARSVAEAGLDAEALDLYTRALVLNGDQALAREALLDAPVAQLAAPALQQRLVDLTEAELVQSPTDILALTREKLEEVGPSGAEPSVEVGARLDGLASAFADAHRQYRIDFARETTR